MKVKNISLSYSIDSDHLSLEQLWGAIAKVVSWDVDNSVSTSYPLEVRELQLETLECLVKILKATHESLRK